MNHIELRELKLGEDGGPAQFTMQGCRVTHVHLSSKCLQHFIADSRFTDLLEPECRLANVTAGILGVISGIGTQISTDVYDHPERPKLPGLTYLIYWENLQ